jgi:hypothetical protein
MRGIFLVTSPPIKQRREGLPRHRHQQALAAGKKFKQKSESPPPRLVILVKTVTQPQH